MFNKISSYIKAYKKVTCDHKNHDHTHVATLHKKEKDYSVDGVDFLYTVNVNECSFCGRHFIDEGLAFSHKDRAKIKMSPLKITATI